MAIRTQHKITESTWFITFTCYNWIPLFELTQSYDLIYSRLKLIKEKNKIETQAFVIMPNHAHLLLNLTDNNVDLNKVISNAKRFIAYELIRRLKVQEKHFLLNMLSMGSTEKEKARGQLEKVFEPSFDAKPVFSIDFLYQKLDYIHHNPVSGKWNLCKEFTDYAHNSAAFYDLNQPHVFVEITDYRNCWFS